MKIIGLHAVVSAVAGQSAVSSHQTCLWQKQSGETVHIQPQLSLGNAIGSPGSQSWSKLDIDKNHYNAQSKSWYRLIMFIWHKYKVYSYYSWQVKMKQTPKSHWIHQGSQDQDKREAQLQLPFFDAMLQCLSPQHMLIQHLKCSNLPASLQVFNCT